MMLLRTALVAALLAAPALAHPDHDAPPAKSRSMAEKAQDAVMAKIARSQLDAAWGSAVPGKPEAHTTAAATHWTVPMRRPGDGRVLMVTLDSDGKFLSAKPAPR